MNENEFFIKAHKGMKLYGKQWPVTSPKAVVCLVHGLGEHCGRYDHVANYFNENEIVVFGYDQRGHGNSGGKRGHTASMELLLEDLELVLMKVRVVYNDLPLFLYGHSMGGNVVANYIIKKDTKELSGAIISSAWLGLVKKISSPLLKMVKLLQNILPSLTIGNGLPLQELSFDQANIEDYKKDPLVHDKISLRLFYQLYQSAAYAMDHASEIKIPVLVGHGDRDGITSFEYSGRFSRSIGENAMFKPWTERKHEVHNDRGKEEVMAFYAGWILSICNLNDEAQNT
jgi:alpha-beta hydrolase superfamily lysophospholipase